MGSVWSGTRMISPGNIGRHSICWNHLISLQSLLHKGHLSNLAPRASQHAMWLHGTNTTSTGALMHMMHFFVGLFFFSLTSDFIHGFSPLFFDLSEKFYYCSNQNVFTRYNLNIYPFNRFYMYNIIYRFSILIKKIPPFFKYQIYFLILIQIIHNP